jgi:hypothetical protein
MKTLFATTIPVDGSWNGHKNILHRLFTWLTGYEILFEESREDLLPEKIQQVSTEPGM